MVVEEKDGEIVLKKGKTLFDYAQKLAQPGDDRCRDQGKGCG